MIRNRYGKVLAPLAVLAFSFGPTVWALQPQEAMSRPFELRPGVIIDPNAGRAYVARPEGGIEAVALAQGTQVWRSGDAATPLALQGDLLVAQAEPSSSNRLEIVVLDMRQQGRRVSASSVDLPSGVRVSVGETLRGSFTARGMASEADVLVRWDYLEHIAQALEPKGPEEEQGPGPLVERGEPRAESGAFRLSLPSGTATPLATAEGVPLAGRSPDLTGADRLRTVPGSQFLSADGRHVLSSERVADDRVWEKYQWTIYNRSSGQRVGELRSYQSQAPFFVSGTLLTHEVGPYQRRDGEKLLEMPLAIRTVDLTAGRELWSRAIRDTTYRGPFPP